MAIRVLINGFGRIGRTVLRTWSQGAAQGGGWPEVEIVALNDIAAPETLAYLFEYDSVFGPFPGGVSLQDRALVFAGHRLNLTHAPDISALDLSGIDLVMECTGQAERRQVAERGLRGGAGRVLISGPSGAAQVTAVIGANEGAITPAHRVISNASCTTNALAPLARVLDAAFGLRTGWMTTIHCYTGSQPTVDAPRGRDLARSRAAALSMVPTTTSAGRLLDAVLPDLAGRIACSAVRVPTASVSAVDLVFQPERPATVERVNAALRDAGGVIGWTDRPLVSTDLRARPESVVMALPQTEATGGGLIRVFGWYDNEWGFSCRMLDMARHLGPAGPAPALPPIG
ncbi:glyceraldehyde 3-phosphate dehydrogenase NAD-binding domain-containing protein [Pararhodobacter sp. SW119]|uniref:type I glyceraldehyde-3-phosphate dehydrogenase n=1 Tax=Pararhodobacter sp. SW119 TaxID=2780075 RepID=UPI001ADFBFAE|nr:glyceraldehyde 3-phosphate dehydrogenase NAD-binding domain-containing protein [Pararhodobacter sp. SW119]